MGYRATERTAARTRATRERIARAALDQVAAGGYASASVQVVARRAGVATGSVYRHFPSKAELFAEVFRRASQRELDVVAAVASGHDAPATDRLAAAVEAFARRALAGPVLAYALIAEPVDPAVEAERLAFRRGYRDVFSNLLEEAVAAAEIPPVAADTVAAALVGALGEALVGPLSPAFTGDGRPTGTHEALVATLVQFSLNSIHKEDSRAAASAHA